jgi:hypothetical protein
MSNGQLNEQQKLILKALAEGLPLQLESGHTGSGKWIDSLNTPAMMLDIATRSGGTYELQYRIKPKTKTVTTQSLVRRGVVSPEYLTMWTSESNKREFIEQSSSFVRWVGTPVTVELEV